MALTSQLDIDTTSGDGDTSCAIDPAFWTANQATLQSYAKQAGVTLYYQDVLQSTTSVSCNVNTLNDAQVQMQQAANRATATGPVTPSPAAAPASSGAVGAVVVVAGALAVTGLAVWALRGSRAAAVAGEPKHLPQRRRRRRFR